jgi:hypothetical protein
MALVVPKTVKTQSDVLNWLSRNWKVVFNEKKLHSQLYSFSNSRDQSREGVKHPNFKIKCFFFKRPLLNFHILEPLVPN